MISIMTDLKKMSDEKLLQWTGGWKQGHPNHLQGLEELARHRERPNRKRSRIAIGVATASLVVAVASLIVAIIALRQR
jgi:hypothetical protein